MRFLILLGLLLLLACERPAEDPHARAERLGEQIRCPVCRGVPINESPATLAKEMMQILNDQIAQGKSDEEILKFFEARYGEWILLEPKAEGINLAIWILPVLAFGGGAWFILRHVKKSGRSA